jgi:hypothetical protein
MAVLVGMHRPNPPRGASGDCQMQVHLLVLPDHFSVEGSDLSPGNHPFQQKEHLTLEPALHLDANPAETLHAVLELIEVSFEMWK